MTDVNVSGTGCPLCWKAILAGAAAAAAVSLILLTLGSGMGLASMSPWSADRFSIGVFTLKMAVALIVMQWISAFVGGYIAGRLRKAPDDFHTNEVFFQDTAQGFLTWCVATLFTAAVLTTTLASVVSGGGKTAAMLASGAMAGANNTHQAASGPPRGGPGLDPMAYYTDGLFRGVQTGTNDADAATRSEVARIFVQNMKNDTLPAEDKEYLVQMVSLRSGLTTEEASTRVDATVAKIQEMKREAKMAADKARKASSAFSIFAGLSMLVGAFIGAVAAVIGGRHRKYYPVVVSTRVL